MEINKRWRILKVQSKKDNPEKAKTEIIYKSILNNMC